MLLSISGEALSEDVVGVGDGSRNVGRGAALFGVTPSKAVPAEYLGVELVEVHCWLLCRGASAMEVTCDVSRMHFLLVLLFERARRHGLSVAGL